MTKNSEVKVIYIKATKEILFRMQHDEYRDSTVEVGVLDGEGFFSEMNTMDGSESRDYFEERLQDLDPTQYIELLEPRAIYEALVELALAKEKGE